MKKLSKSSKRRVDGILRSLDDIRTSVTKFDEDQITELVRRAAIPISPDSYPASGMAESTSGGSISDPTGSTAVGKISRDHPPIDYLSGSVKSIERALRNAEKQLRDSLGILEGVKRSVEGAKERPSSNPCAICHELPAEKAAWCLPDYNDWWKHGSPDRLRWEMFKRRDVDEDGELRVPECPPPSEGRSAIRGPWKNAS